MPDYIISLKEGSSADELAKAKQHVKDQGGSIKAEFTLIKGFTASFPADKITTLRNNPHLDVEEDKEVHTQ